MVLLNKIVIYITINWNLMAQGKVCSLSDQFSWAEKIPLGQKRVIITKYDNNSTKLKDMLIDLGAEVVELPTIDHVPILANIQLNNVISNVEKYQWIVFTSEVSVEIFFNALADKKIDIRSLINIKFVLDGLSTMKAIEKHGIFTGYVNR